MVHETDVPMRDASSFGLGDAIRVSATCNIICEYVEAKK